MRPLGKHSKRAWLKRFRIRLSVLVTSMRWRVGRRLRALLRALKWGLICYPGFLFLALEK